MGISGKMGQSQTEKRGRYLEAPETRDPRDKPCYLPSYPGNPSARILGCLCKMERSDL